MTLWDDLKDYFDKNTDTADSAMFGESLWGYEYDSSWGDTKGTYVVSDFEMWAMENNVAKPSLVDDYGGEDMGSTYYTVHKFTRGDEEVFIKFYGFYSSYNGTDYEGFCQVFPKEVTKVEYV
jgi:hypothetical protein